MSASHSSLFNRDFVVSTVIPAAGHSLFLLLGAIYLATSVSFLYRIALLMLCAANVCELYGLLSRSGAGENVFSTILSHEGSPYTFLGIALYLLPSSRLVLLSLLVRSLYAALAIARSSTELSRQKVWRQYGMPIGDQLQAFRSTATTICTYIEVAALPWLLVNVFSSGILIVVIYAAFVRWQFAVSARMRLTIGALDEAATKVVAHPSCPPQVRAGFAQFRSYLSRLSMPIAAPSN